MKFPRICLQNVFSLIIERDKSREQEVDKRPESLVYVEGVEAQALFNFLMNCKSAISAVGPLAGVPPTLLAPVAFNGATLKALKVSGLVFSVVWPTILDSFRLCHFWYYN